MAFFFNKDILLISLLKKFLSFPKWICHPDEGQNLFFFQTMFDFFFFIPSSLLFFLKNYYHSTKGMEPAQSPKPAVSLPLNPSFLGHGSGLCPKNLLSSKVISVNYEQFRVGFFTPKNFFYLFQNEYFSYPFFITIFS